MAEQSIEEIIKKANEWVQNHYKKKLAELEEKYKDTNPLPQEAINEIGILKDKIKQ